VLSPRPNLGESPQNIAIPLYNSQIRSKTSNRFVDWNRTAWNMRGAQPYTKYLPVRELEDGPISLSLVENLWILLLIIFSEFY
jgi:hypothetical protein